MVAVVADAVMAMSVKMLLARPSADAVEESLLVVDALIVKCGAAFATYLPVFGPHLLRCLREFTEPHVGIAAVGIVSALSHEVGAARMLPVFDSIMQVLFARLEVRALILCWSISLS